MFFPSALPVEMTWPTKPDEKGLKPFREPVLAGGTERPYTEEFRFIWMRTFDPPVAIRAFADKDGARLRVVRLDGKGGYELGKIDLDKTADLTKNDWDELKALTKRPKARHPLRGMTVFQKVFLYPLDGSTWTLEVRNTENYSHEIVPSPLTLIRYIGRKEELVDDFVLPDVRDFAAVCQRLLKLARSAEPKLFEDEDLY